MAAKIHKKAPIFRIPVDCVKQTSVYRQLLTFEVWIWDISSWEINKSELCFLTKTRKFQKFLSRKHTLTKHSVKNGFSKNNFRLNSTKLLNHSKNRHQIKTFLLKNGNFWCKYIYKWIFASKSSIFLKANQMKKRFLVMMMTAHWTYNLNVFETNFDLIITELNFIFKNITIFSQNWWENDLQCVFNANFLFTLSKMAYRINQSISLWTGYP